MMENISLKPFNTFGIDVKARFFAEVFTEDDLVLLISRLDREKLPFFILGGGSNLLLTKDYEGTVVKIATKGMELIAEAESEVFVKGEAGENWDDFVAYCVGKGWGGLENLSLIPGNIGAGPVQNIGAYGTEIRDTVVEVCAFDRFSGQRKVFSNSECEFAYRDSIFKKNKGRYVILNVSFRLSRKPFLHLDYGDIVKELESMKITTPGISDVRDAVCRIRGRKLPDPAEIGNSGSFFKNPVISSGQFLVLKEKFPGIVAFPQGDQVKIAAGWLIEQCGWKGYRKADAGVHPNQSLVLVNYANATGQEILDLANAIKNDVLKKSGVVLETEVNIL